MKMIVVERPTAHLVWCTIRNLFLKNADQRAIYTFQKFHSMYQGDLSVNTYFSRLKELADLLRDVGHPVSEPAMVVNALRGLSSRFSHAIPNITARHPLPSFNYVRDYIVQLESGQAHTAKMEAASALLATESASTTPPPARPPTTYALPTSTPPASGGDRRKKRKNFDGKKNNNGGTSVAGGSPIPAWTPVANPWTGVVQAWPVPIWRPPTSGLLGPRPGNTQQQALVAASFPGDMATFAQAPPQAPPGLVTALHGMVPPAQYQGGGDWILDTGATSHVANNSGILSSSHHPQPASSIIVGNGAPIPVHNIGSTSIATSQSPLKLNNVMISPHQEFDFRSCPHHR